MLLRKIFLIYTLKYLVLDYYVFQKSSLYISFTLNGLENCLTTRIKLLLRYTAEEFSVKTLNIKFYEKPFFEDLIPRSLRKISIKMKSSKSKHCNKCVISYGSSPNLFSTDLCNQRRVICRRHSRLAILVERVSETTVFFCFVQPFFQSRKSNLIQFEKLSPEFRFSLPKICGQILLTVVYSVEKLLLDESIWVATNTPSVRAIIARENVIIWSHCITVHCVLKFS